MKNDIEICKCTTIHENVVDKVKKEITSDEKLKNLSAFFKAFADDTRIKIINALLISEMCVCDLAASLNMTHSAISHQLRTFKAAKLVKSRKEGKVVYYSLADSHIQQIFHQGYEHICEN